MSELGDVKALAVVASGLGWTVGKVGSGFEVRIDRESGNAFFGTTVEYPATEAIREDAKDRLLEAATADVELDRIAEAFVAPWVQA